MNVKVMLPTTTELDIPPQDGVRFVHYDPAEPIAAEHEDAEVLVVWGQDDLRDAASRLTNVKWVQMLSAGTDAAMKAGFSRDVVLTSGSSLHDLPVAEHALALTLAAARRLHTLVRAQIGHRWASEIGGPQREPSPGLFSTLRGARVLVWGFGSIATSLAPHLEALGATVTGAATSAREQDGYRVIATEDLNAELPNTDVLVMILPSGPSTEKALDAERLALLPDHAWVVNVGRGSTVDEDALLAELRAGTLGGAALDVTSVEPLPAESPLWDQPNLIITPHAAGGRPLGAVGFIQEQLAAYLDGRELRNVVPLPDAD
ncbi:NAD(P)-dependent oxidoreductase [Planctomonas psychrotolerans]|uniref:NAD(P)-dependent oxidoreductase n=1 Tax=Planctomonas psychrotolerans TaxID=2528712 RepID=UPI00123A8D89|nr:NAD(P)-dependent oxidoreductase [Planctomonas psychrotolerans]